MVMKILLIKRLLVLKAKSKKVGIIIINKNGGRNNKLPLLKTDGKFFKVLLIFFFKEIYFK